MADRRHERRLAAAVGADEARCAYGRARASLAVGEERLAAQLDVNRVDVDILAALHGHGDPAVWHEREREREEWVQNEEFALSAGDRATTCARPAQQQQQQMGYIRRRARRLAAARPSWGRGAARAHNRNSCRRRAERRPTPGRRRVVGPRRAWRAAGTAPSLGAYLDHNMSPLCLGRGEEGRRASPVCACGSSTNNRS